MFRVRSLGRSSRPRAHHQAPPSGFSFPPPGPAGPVPRLHQYYEGATTSCRPSHRTSFPSFGGTSVALVIFAPRRTSAPPRPGVGHPVPPAGFRRGDDRISQSSWGTTIVRLHMFQSDAGRTACTRPYGAAAWPLVIERQRLPRLGLSTLNSMASGLAVYASQCGLLQHHARLASSCWSGSTRAGFPPESFR